VETSDPSLSMGKGEVGVGGEGWRTCPPRGAGTKWLLRERRGCTGGHCSVRQDRGSSSTVLCLDVAAVQLYGPWASLLAAAAAAEPCLKTTLIQFPPSSCLNQLG